MFSARALVLPDEQSEINKAHRLRGDLVAATQTMAGFEAAFELAAILFTLWDKPSPCVVWYIRLSLADLVN